MNPFRLNYKKREDKVTNLLIHVLQRCNLFVEFLNAIRWEAQEITFSTSTYNSGLQVHSDFRKAVENAYILGISNSGKIEPHTPSSQKESNPDAYLYEKTSRSLVFIEVKVGDGALTENQINRHKLRVPDFPKNEWILGQMNWFMIRDFFKEQLQSIKCRESELYTYIIENFIGVLQEEVLGEYNEEYLIHVSGERSLLVKNLLTLLRNKYANFTTKLENGSHDAVQFKIGSTRIATFVLKSDRFILHPGKSYGYEWRHRIKEGYGIYYDQGELYEDELCIPYDSINPLNLELISNNQSPLFIEDLLADTLKCKGILDSLS